MNAPMKCTILLSMLGLLALEGCSKAPPPAPGPPDVTVAKVISKRIKDWDEYTGRFQAVDTVEVLRWVGRNVGDADARYDRIGAVLSRR